MAPSKRSPVPTAAPTEVAGPASATLRCGSLVLSPDDALDPQLWQRLEHDLEAIAATLLPWGAFRWPVRVCSAPDLDSLRRLADGPTDGLLYAAATPHTIAVLAPSRWPRPPAGAALTRLLTHELAHALLFQRCAPDGRHGPVALPCFFREGMAVLASEGRPPHRRRQQAAARHDLIALADAETARFGDDAEAVYDAAVTLFDAWFESFGPRRMHALCRAMRAGAGFAEAHRTACGLAWTRWLSETAAALQAPHRAG